MSDKLKLMDDISPSHVAKLVEMWNDDIEDSVPEVLEFIVDFSKARWPDEDVPEDGFDCWGWVWQRYEADGPDWDGYEQFWADLLNSQKKLRAEFWRVYRMMTTSGDD